MKPLKLRTYCKPLLIATLLVAAATKNAWAQTCQASSVQLYVANLTTLAPSESEALIQCGTSIIPVVQTALQNNNDPLFHLKAIEVLQRLHLPSEETLAWIANTPSYFLNVRLRAIRALVELKSPSAPKFFPILIDALQYPDVNIRSDSTWILGMLAGDKQAFGSKPFGQQTDLVVQKLVERLQDPSEDVRENVAVALGKIGSDAKSAVPLLIKVLDSSSPHTRAAK